MRAGPPMEAAGFDSSRAGCWTLTLLPVHINLFPPQTFALTAWCFSMFASELSYFSIDIKFGVFLRLPRFLSEILVCRLLSPLIGCIL
jgi:hypothetical protein